MGEEKERFAVKWYRTPIERDVLRQLNERSDLKGLINKILQKQKEDPDYQYAAPLPEAPPCFAP